MTSIKRIKISDKSENKQGKNMSTKPKTYTLTQRDYDILLSSVLHNPIALGVLQRIAGNTSDKLDENKMSELFSANYHGITYFNFETNKWNRNNYKIDAKKHQGIDTVHAQELKRNIEQDPNMRDIEVIAAVAMTINEPDYPGWGEIIHNPKFSATGKSVIGTIVRRDKRTGKILPVTSEWMGIHQMQPRSFVFNGFRYFDFARIFRKTYGLEK